MMCPEFSVPERGICKRECFDGTLGVPRKGATICGEAGVCQHKEMVDVRGECT